MYSDSMSFSFDLSIVIRVTDILFYQKPVAIAEFCPSKRGVNKTPTAR